MPNDVIKRIYELDVLQKQPKCINFFHWNMESINLEQGYSISHTDYDIEVYKYKPMSELRNGVHDIDGNEEVNIVDVDEERDNDEYFIT